MKEYREKLKTWGRVWFLIPQLIQYNFCNLCQFEEWGEDGGRYSVQRDYPVFDINNHIAVVIQLLSCIQLFVIP